MIKGPRGRPVSSTSSSLLPKFHRYKAGPQSFAFQSFTSHSFASFLLLYEQQLFPCTNLPDFYRKCTSNPHSSLLLSPALQPQAPSSPASF
jgi:hypothetical protein